jgi:hypothetical protein
MKWKVHRGMFASEAARDMFPFASKEIVRQCLPFTSFDGPGLAQERWTGAVKDDPICHHWI